MTLQVADRQTKSHTNRHILFLTVSSVVDRGLETDRQADRKMDRQRDR